MKLLLLWAGTAVPGVALAHHSPDHVVVVGALLAPPAGFGHLGWVLGPFVLLAIVGVVRAVRRRRGKG